MPSTVEAPPAGIAAPLPGWVGALALDASGTEVGHVRDVLFDARSGGPGWLLLALPDAGEPVLVPARGLRHRVRGVQLAVGAEAIRTAPATLAPPDGLARGEALTLAAHYGVRCGGGPWHGVAAPTLTDERVRT